MEALLHASKEDMKSQQQQQQGAGVRRRGRPLGSRNIPKPPKPPQPQLPAPIVKHYLQIPENGDIIQCISAYAQRKAVGLNILSGRGYVKSANLCVPGPGGIVHELTTPFNIINLTGSINLGTPRKTNVIVLLGGVYGYLSGGFVVSNFVAGVGSVVITAEEILSSHIVHVLSSDSDMIFQPFASHGAPSTDPTSSNRVLSIARG